MFRMGWKKSMRKQHSTQDAQHSSLKQIAGPTSSLPSTNGFLRGYKCDV